MNLKNTLLITLLLSSSSHIQSMSLVLREITPLSSSAYPNQNREDARNIVEDDEVEALEILIKQGSINPSQDSDLLILAAFRFTPLCLELLIKNGWDMNYQNEYGKTALSTAVERRLLTNVKILIEHDADINQLDPNENTPLDIASFDANTAPCDSLNPNQDIDYSKAPNYATYASDSIFLTYAFGNLEMTNVIIEKYPRHYRSMCDDMRANIKEDNSKIIEYLKDHNAKTGAQVQKEKELSGK